MAVDMNIVNETMENLKKRQFRPFFVEKKEDVLLAENVNNKVKC